MPHLRIERLSPATITLDGRQLIAFAGCNYLGLAQHPAVLQAMSDGAARWGLSAAAARQTTGNASVYEELELALARLVGTPEAVLVPDGYTANLAAAQALRPTLRHALLDARAHRSLCDAAHAAELACATYPHRDASAAGDIARGISSDPGSIAVFTDGIFAADGAVAPLDELVASLPADTLLIVDDCHGVGIMGSAGHGTAAALLGSSPRTTRCEIIITGTLAKALGCSGGFVAGEPWMCEAVRRGSIYTTTTPPSPALAAAALEAISILNREPERLARLRERTTQLEAGLRSAGLNLHSAGLKLPDAPPRPPIFAFTLRPPEVMDAVRDALLESGYLAPILSYPQGPAERYFRLSVSSEHTPGQIDGLVESLVRHLGG
jgi:8-amino-7-oxononanoate synthase